MSKPISIVHHPDYTATLPSNHRFPMNKFTTTMTAIRASDIPIIEHEPEPMPREWLTQLHDDEYVAAILSCTLDAELTRRIGFAITPTVARRAELATGGTYLTAQLALAEGVACNTAGGSHHAHASFGSGFCVFNDVAVAAKRLLIEERVARVLVTDLDVHQGDGTAALFANEPRVFTFSLHCEANFPARKQRSDLDIGLNVDTGDDDYCAHVADVVPRLLSAHRPDIVFYIAGVDPHRDDKLGRLALSDAGLLRRDQMVGKFCGNAGVPMAVVMGGGYGEDIIALGQRHANSLLGAALAWHGR